MRITPLDVRKQEFRKAVRGFDCDEVRAFLTTLADEYEAVLVDNKQIRERLLEQNDKLSEYQKMERNLRDTLMTAERVMQETRENASREGELIVKDAQMKARGVLEECRLRTEELRREIVSLRKEKETYLARFRSLAEAQIQFVDTHRSDFEDLDKRLTDIVDSVVTRTGTVERTDAPRPAPRTPRAPTAPTAAAFAATAPRPETFGPVPAPAPSASDNDAPAPAAGSDTAAEWDIWRDYNPGAEPAARGGSAARPERHERPERPAAPFGPPPAPPAPRDEDPGENDLNHMLSETLAEKANPVAPPPVFDAAPFRLPEAPAAAAPGPNRPGSPEDAVAMATLGIPIPAVPRRDVDHELGHLVSEVSNV